MGICVGNAFCLLFVFFLEWVYTLWGENEKNLYVFFFVAFVVLATRYRTVQCVCEGRRVVLIR